MKDPVKNIDGREIIFLDKEESEMSNNIAYQLFELASSIGENEMFADNPRFGPMIFFAAVNFVILIAKFACCSKSELIKLIDQFYVDDDVRVSEN
jgi:hypothetical protein